jgi:hypothetical protein
MQRTLALLSIILLNASFAFSQAGFGSIAGKITDPNGQAIPGVKVSAINVATGQRIESISNDVGDYQVLQLIPGEYTLHAEAANFKRLERAAFKVQVGDRLTIDLGMEVGGVDETVSVSAEAPLLRTQDAQIGEVVTEDMIHKLPQLNRNPLELLRISGNVQGGGGEATGGSDTRINGGRTQGIDYLIDGITATTGLAHGITATRPTMETVSEFRVITNPISAEYGRVSGGAVELVTKSGGNDFHGQIFSYFKDEIFNANSWEQNFRGGKRPEFREHNYGFLVNGPLMLPKFGEGGKSYWSGRNKSFFTFNYDAYRYREAGRLRVASVPTLRERQGDLSQTRFNNQFAPVYDPDGPQVYNEAEKKWERTQLLGGDGRTVPQNRIDPVASAIMGMMPLPNRDPRPGSSSADNFQATQETENENNYWSARIDHNFNEKHRLFGRYTRSAGEYSQTNWRGPLSTAPGSRTPGAFNLTLNYDWTISPTLLFNARVGGHYNPHESGSLLQEGFTSTGIPFDPITRGLIGNEGLVRIAGGWMGGDTEFTSHPGRRTSHLTTGMGTFSLLKTFTRHTLKVGYEHRRYYDNYSTSGSSDWKYIYAPVNRFAEDRGWDDAAQASSIASFLLGRMNLISTVGPSDRATNTNYHGAYIQDDFKVNNKLTLNFGLRWDMEMPTTERHNKLYFWDDEAPSQFRINPGWSWAGALTEAGIDPSRVPTPDWVTQGFPRGALRIAGTPEHPERSGQKLEPFQFAPRFGFAYQANDKTVVRGSVGKMYMSTTGNPESVGGGPGVQLADSADAGWHSSDPRYEPFRYITSTFSSPYEASDISRYTRDSRIANFQTTGGDNGPGSYSRNSHMPHEWTWTIGLQRELPKGFLVETYYQGNRGRELLARDLVSRFPRQLYTGGPQGQNASLYRTLVRTPTFGQTRENEKIPLAFLMYPYPYYRAFLVMGANIGKSDYHSWNVRAERRFSNDVAFVANYTLGRLYDNVGGPDAGSGGGINNGGGTGGRSHQSVDTIRDIYGVSPLDERHRLALTYLVSLPIGRGRTFLGEPSGVLGTALDYVVGGWELAGTTIYRSGRPVVFGFSNGNSAGNDIRVEWTTGSFTSDDRNLLNPNFNSKDQVFAGPNDPRPAMSIFDTSKISNAQSFVYGNVPATYPDIRQPSSWDHQLALMKSFPIFGESRYLQFRMEATNVFNMRGFGNFNTQVGSDDFGRIRGGRYQERRIQMSARFVW